MSTIDSSIDAEARIDALCDELLSRCDPKAAPASEFLGHQFDLGLAWVNFPEGHGGLGLSPKLQTRINRRLEAADAPSAWLRNPIGYGMGAPTIVTHGSDVQKRRYLRPLFTGEEIWCQLFSEPGAGSDVAGLSTRAVRDGDEWVVNGQKVWTSLAHRARWGMLVARTDPDQPKHKGLTYFVVDMHQPGVEARPLRQMTGDAEFNEVYFTNARVPDIERMGEVGEGWRVSLTTLMNERVAIGGTVPPKGSGPIRYAVRAWQRQAHGSEESPAVAAQRDELMRLWVQAEVLRLTNIRASEMRKTGTPGPEGSIGKLASADLNKEITSFTMNLMGAEGMLYETGYRGGQLGSGMDFANPPKAFLRCRANSIEGGTTEVMKNILGERVLGLPGDVRTDKDLPWIDVPRN
ncbi:MAG: acyl-CoA dehydrogenase family protein [Acidimicrobiia bacterium]|nr:acyl-CoA dehydrogenase family protein [Acidimicrobiia bacterium]MDH4365528.1 acyl-CoA dehydrogenase family protein [Acidimicrobiia bacterium]